MPKIRRWWILLQMKNHRLHVFCCTFQYFPVFSHILSAISYTLGPTGASLFLNCYLYIGSNIIKIFTDWFKSCNHLRVSRYVTQYSIHCPWAYWNVCIVYVGRYYETWVGQANERSLVNKLREVDITVLHKQTNWHLAGHEMRSLYL